MDSAIKRAEKKLEYLSSDEEALALYRACEDSAHERANLIYTGRMEGNIEGKIEGRIEGKIEGRIEGEIKLIRTLQELLQLPVSGDEAFEGKSLEELRLQASLLQDKIRNRSSS